VLKHPKRYQLLSEIEQLKKENSRLKQQEEEQTMDINTLEKSYYFIRKNPAYLRI